MGELKQRPKQRRASENIWCVLSTIAGEPEHIYDPVIDKNRYYWNGLMALWLTETEKSRLLDVNKEPLILPSLTDADMEEIQNTLNVRFSSEAIIPLKSMGIDFSKTTFTKIVDFSGFVFAGQTDFTSAFFVNEVKFTSSFFTNSTVFSSAAFAKFTMFNSVTFSDSVIFSSVNFSNGADFSSVKFGESAYFDKTLFLGVALFNTAIFCGLAQFDKTIFKKSAEYKFAIFMHIASFEKTTFKNVTNFSKVEFSKSPPVFYESTISEAFIWEGTIFPLPPKDKEETVMHKNAYERLALMMSKQEKHHDRHMFWRHEMRARRALDTGWKKLPAKFMNWVYDKTCDYGYGFGRALTLWGVHIILCAFLLFIPAPHNWAGVVNSVATSFANAHSFLGLNRGPLNNVYADYAKWDLFNVVWAVQGLLGIMFLFFLILTIRNRFKMG